METIKMIMLGWYIIGLVGSIVFNLGLHWPSLDDTLGTWLETVALILFLALLGPILTLPMGWYALPSNTK